MALDYGICPCTGEYQHRFVEVRMRVDNRLILLKNIPQGTCVQCGSRVFKAEYLEYIESTMKSPLLERFKSRLQE